MQKVISQAKIQCGEPRVFVVPREGERNFQTWIDAIQTNVKDKADSIQILIFLLPGKKTDTKIYAPLKSYLSSSLGIPSQVVLNQTIEKGKNILSIVSKVLLQITAKLGARPWVMDKLPLFTEPVLVSSLVVEKKSGSNNIFFTYSIDPRASK